MKTWNLGNTTVRNPERIKGALQVFKDRFEDRVFNKAAQKEFFNTLIERGVIAGDPGQAGSKDLSGRKWVSSFKKLGLVLTAGTRGGLIITLSAVGNALLSNTIIESDIFLRQMLKVQLPSPTEEDLENAAIHPFYLVLNVSVLLKEKSMKGITKEEIALFLQSAINNNQAEKIVEKIKHYRDRRDIIVGRMEKRKFFLAQLTLKAKELYGAAASEQKVRTLQDYSDTTVRYSAITGIFSVGQQSLLLKEDQFNLAKAIVNKGAPKVLANNDFLKVFYNPSLPVLPTDNTEFLQRDIRVLIKSLNQLSEQTGLDIEDQPDVLDKNILELKRQREDLEQELTSLKEIQFYRSQSKIEQIEEIKNLFESIMARETIGGSDYRPAWAEWGVWRIFLSINTIVNPINETRGFKINSELQPIHHAKGGAADLFFQYNDNVLVPTEVTLSKSERQFNMEGEPVKFHVKLVAEENQNSEVIGVFTAPDIHVATAHEFFIAEVYSEKMGKVIKLDIIPLTFKQLGSFLPGEKNACSNGMELLITLRKLIQLKKTSQNGAVWLKQINQLLTT